MNFKYFSVIQEHLKKKSYEAEHKELESLREQAVSDDTERLKALGKPFLLYPAVQNSTILGTMLFNPWYMLHFLEICDRFRTNQQVDGLLAPVSYALPRAITQALSERAIDYSQPITEIVWGVYYNLIDILQVFLPTYGTVGSITSPALMRVRRHSNGFFYDITPDKKYVYVREYVYHGGNTLIYERDKHLVYLHTFIPIYLFEHGVLQLDNGIEVEPVDSSK